jgi:hypothetical protein
LVVYGNGVNFGSRTVGVLNPDGTTLYPGGAPDGSNVGVVFLLDDFGNQTHFVGIEAGIEQTLATVLETDTVYTLTLTPGVGSRYFLVVPQGGSYEGSYGDATTGSRPASLSACRTQRVVDCSAD